MTGTQWPETWRINAVTEDLQNPADMKLYTERGMTGLVELKAYQRVAQVMAARHDPVVTAPTTPTIQPPTKREEPMTIDVTNTRPLRSLPSRLDAAACLQVLAQITDATTTDLAAAAETVTIEKVDAGLATTSLSIDDRMKFKHALSQHGIISRGRRTSISHL
jgi:hypothetical protein